MASDNSPVITIYDTLQLKLKQIHFHWICISYSFGLDWSKSPSHCRDLHFHSDTERKLNYIIFTTYYRVSDRNWNKSWKLDSSVLWYDVLAPWRTLFIIITSSAPHYQTSLTFLSGQRPSWRWSLVVFFIWNVSCCLIYDCSFTSGYWARREHCKKPNYISTKHCQPFHCADTSQQSNLDTLDRLGK